VLLLFPNGRLPSPRWRVVGAAVTTVVVVTVVGYALYPAAFETFWVAGRAGNPLGIPVSPESYRSWMMPVFTLAWVSVLVAVASLLWRWRNAETTARRQLAWPVLGTLLGLGIAVTPAEWMLLPLVPFVVPTAVVAAIRWRGLYGTERLLSRSLVYVAGSLLVLGLLAAVVAVSGSLIGRAGGLIPAVVVTAVLTAGFNPVRRWLQQWVDRAVYGRRGDPAAAVSHLGTRLSAMLTPDDVPKAVVDVIATSLGVRQVAVLGRVDGSMRVLAERGGVPHGDTVLSIPLSGADGLVGRLLLARRAPRGAVHPYGSAHADGTGPPRRAGRARGAARRGGAPVAHGIGAHPRRRTATATS
jgi:two-component system, NarL family, sensor kinase